MLRSRANTWPAIYVTTRSQRQPIVRVAVRGSVCECECVYSSKCVLIPAAGETCATRLCTPMNSRISLKNIICTPCTHPAHPLPRTYTRFAHQLHTSPCPNKYICCVCVSYIYIYMFYVRRGDNKRRRQRRPKR